MVMLKNEIAIEFERQRGFSNMSLWKNRDGYTRSKKWPVVPFRLTRYEEEAPHKVEYKIGLDVNLVLGWTVGLSKTIVPHHPIMVWEKECIAKQKDIGGCSSYVPVETELYYEILSPICNLFRKEKDFFISCRKQDNNVVDKVFQLMDQIASEGKDISALSGYYSLDNIGGHCGESNLTIQALHKNGKIYFEYQCPCLKLTELIFPIMCEGITIAVVVMGQIIEDLESLKSMINDSYPDKYNSINWKEVKPDKKELVVSTILEHISILEEEYRQQMIGERRRIMNETLDTLTLKFLSRSHNNAMRIKDIIKTNVEIIIEAKKFMKDEMGLEEIYLYLDEDDLKSIVYKDGMFYKKLLNDIKELKDDEDTKKQRWYDSLDKVGDLFSKENTPLIYNDKRPEYIYEDGENKDKWSIFIMLPSTKDEAIVLGIKYKGKKRFLRKEQENATLFEKYLLPKFVMLVQNTILRVEAQHDELVLTENREMLSHEVGQVAAGIRALNKKFSHVTIDNKSGLSNRTAKNDYDALETAYKAFIEKSELYKKDVEGQFEIIEMLSKIYGDDIVPIPKTFDLWTEFFHRWHLIFNAKCSVNNHYLDMPFVNINTNLRAVSTDSLLLQCALYNIVNNEMRQSFCTRLKLILSMMYSRERGFKPSFLVSQKEFHWLFHAPWHSPCCTSRRLVR